MIDSFCDMDNSWVEIIKKRADEIRDEHLYPDVPIRDDIFKILRKRGVLVFYPIEDEKDLDGFHVDRIMNGEIVPFVYINTANYWDKCIFCAAHELGHIYKIENDIKRLSNQFVIDDSLCDDIMNRFAAELLMPESKFKEVFDPLLEKCLVESDSIKDQDILKIAIELMDYFFVPYKAVVKRLSEIGFLTALGLEHYIDYNDTVIESYISDVNNVRSKQIVYLRQMDGLEDYVRKTQNNRSINEETINKLCKDFGIENTDEVEKYINQSASNVLEDDLYNVGGSV